MIMYIYVKRILDVLFSLVLLPLFFIVFIIVGLIILLEDKGSIIFYSKRLGKDGRIFTMYKFRTMIMNAPDIRLADGSTYNSEDDPRITRIGRILRKTSIDELPQILNVIKGDMSIIGPRPDPVDWIDRYTELQKRKLLVLPGITGYNQAYYRNSGDGEQVFERDDYYVSHLSFCLDVRVFFKTIQTIILRKNIYVDDTRK